MNEYGKIMEIVEEVNEKVMEEERNMNERMEEKDEIESI